MKEPDPPRYRDLRPDLAEWRAKNPAGAKAMREMEQLSGLKAEDVVAQTLDEPTFTEDQLVALEKAQRNRKLRDRLMLIAVIAIVLFLSIGWGMGWLPK